MPSHFCDHGGFLTCIEREPELFNMRNVPFNIGHEFSSSPISSSTIIGLEICKTLDHMYFFTRVL